jgi:type IV pilus assembly protein PilF
MMQRMTISKTLTKGVIFALCVTGATLLNGCSSPISGNRTVDRSAAARARLTLGLAYLEQDNLKLAYRNIQRAVRYDPDNYRTHLALALYEQRIGEYDRARESYRLALKRAPKESPALSGYGSFLCELGEYQSANEQFELALNHTSYDNIAESLERAGYCFLKQGRNRRAQELISRAVKHDPAKSKYLLAVTEHYLNARQHEQVAILLDIYQQNSPITAESLWLQIGFARLNQAPDDEQRYGRQLAEHFSQSEQYKKFLANEN